MMHLLRKYDVAPFGRNDAMFAQCAARHASLGEAVIIGEANIICRRQTSFKNAPLSVDKSAFFVGCGGGIFCPSASIVACCRLRLLGSAPSFSALLATYSKKKESNPFGVPAIEQVRLRCLYWFGCEDEL